MDLFLVVEIAGKNFSLLLYRPVLKNGSGVVKQLAMHAQSMGEEKYLGMESPGLHIGIEISQVWIIGNRFIKWLPAELITK